MRSAISFDILCYRPTESLSIFEGMQEHIETNTDSDRKLASIQIVESVSKHDNADALEIATVLGWQIVIRIGEAHPNQLVVYCEIDSVLPNADWLPQALKDKLKESNSNTHRLKTAKLRGEISQGLIVPLHSSMPFDITKLTAEDVGRNVTEQLGIVKYEPPALSGKFAMFQTNSKLQFPTHIISKTDETRVQSQPKVLQWMANKPYYSTVKCDGTSGTFFIGSKTLLDEEADPQENTLIVCSRNQMRKRPANLKVCPYWYVAEKYNLEGKLMSYPHIGIQGEVCGPNIQKNLLGLKDLELFVFNVVDLREPGGRVLDYPDMIAMINELGLQPVPIVEVNDEFRYTSVKELLQQAEGVYPKSKKTREGLVYRLQDQSLSFKVINNKYLLKTGQ
jgi:RNA ligase (TIGR02306 family)